VNGFEHCSKWNAKNDSQHRKKDAELLIVRTVLSKICFKPIGPFSGSAVVFQKQGLFCIVQFGGGCSPVICFQLSRAEFLRKAFPRLLAPDAGVKEETFMTEETPEAQKVMVKFC